MKASTLFVIWLKITAMLYVFSGVLWWTDLGDPGWSDALRATLASAIVLLMVWLQPKDEAEKYERGELHRRRVASQEYLRWLGAEFPDVDLVLRNMEAEARDEALCVSWPPSLDGPWEVSRLREVLRKRRAVMAPSMKPQGDAL